MTREALSYIHRFEEGAAANVPPLLLLHGTGGDENDLIPLARMVAPDAPLLSPRGKVLENGMPRFFRRLAEGVFDEEDVRRRAQEIADFVEGARGQYSISSPIALGYSNGANIAAAILLAGASGSARRRDPAAGNGAIVAVAGPRLERQAGLGCIGYLGSYYSTGERRAISDPFATARCCCRTSHPTNRP
jgi:pimeloyl-ACP methyl ester carboxylesterase